MSSEPAEETSPQVHPQSLQEPLPVVPPIEAPKPAPRGRPMLTLGVLGTGIFLAYKVVPFYYYYFDIKSNCAQVLRNAGVESDQELRRSLLEVVHRNGVEAEPRDIGIQRVGGRIKIWLNYREHLDVSVMGKSITLHTFDFTPSAERAVEE